MYPQTLNKNGWRLVNPPIPGYREGLDLSGLLIARDDKRGYGLLKVGPREITIRIEWFRPNSGRSSVAKSAVRPPRTVSKSKLDLLLEQLASQGLV